MEKQKYTVNDYIKRDTGKKIYQDNTREMIEKVFTNIVKRSIPYETSAQERFMEINSDKIILEDIKNITKKLEIDYKKDSNLDRKDLYFNNLSPGEKIINTVKINMVEFYEKSVEKIESLARDMNTYNKLVNSVVVTNEVKKKISKECLEVLALEQTVEEIEKQEGETPTPVDANTQKPLSGETPSVPEAQKVNPPKIIQDIQDEVGKEIKSAKQKQQLVINVIKEVADAKKAEQKKIEDQRIKLDEPEQQPMEPENNPVDINKELDESDSEPKTINADEDDLDEDEIPVKNDPSKPSVYTPPEEGETSEEEERFDY